MIYPANYDITILQNATFKTQIRCTQGRKTITSIQTVSGMPTFTAACHDLEADDKVVFTGSSACGLNENTVYYVIASGLTADAFQVSATVSGSSLAITGDFANTLYVAKPVDITGYTVDADIKETTGYTQVATFSCSLITPADGLAQLLLDPATTVGLDVGTYAYDVSLTSGGGERYYWLTGNAAVVRTYSRT